MENPQTTQAVLKAVSQALQIDNKALFLKTTSIQFIEHRSQAVANLWTTFMD